MTKLPDPFKMPSSTFVGIIDLMKKGLWLIVLIVVSAIGVALESLTWWKRDCDAKEQYLIIPTAFLRWNHWPDEKGIVTLFYYFPPIFLWELLESLTWWKRDCDFFISLLFFITSYPVGIIDLMKKGLWLFSFFLFFYFRGFLLESLTWWKRDCD